MRSELMECDCIEKCYMHGCFLVSTLFGTSILSSFNVFYCVFAKAPPLSTPETIRFNVECTCTNRKWLPSFVIYTVVPVCTLPFLHLYMSGSAKNFRNKIGIVAGVSLHFIGERSKPS